MLFGRPPEGEGSGPGPVPLREAGIGGNWNPPRGETIGGLIAPVGGLDGASS
jgi:hypothetical protein